MLAPFNFFFFLNDGYAFVCVCVGGGGGGGNSMFIVLTGVLVLISMLFLNGCFYKMCCFQLSCGTMSKFL